MHLKRVWQSSACSLRCAIGVVRRWPKPLVLAAAITATALSYSCKKFDPRDYIDRKPVAEDTTTFGKKKFVEIGKRVFADEKPKADTIVKDTASIFPIKPKSIVDAPGND